MAGHHGGCAAGPQGYIVAESGRKLAIAITVNQAMFDDIQGVFDANEDLGKIATSIYESY